MGDVRLISPRVRVTRDGHEAIELQTDNRDLIRWDQTRLRHKWPTMDAAPFLWMTFISWAAARRTGAIPEDYRYETWEAEVLEVQALTDEDDTGIPTGPGPDPG